MFSNYSKLLKKEIIIAFKNNRFLVLFSTVLFLGSMLTGYIFSGFLASFLTPIVSNFKERVVSGEIKIETFSIFKNNLNVIIMMYVGGIALGILPAIILVYNGLFIGYFASLSVNISKFLILTLPHGIFEIPAIILAASASFVFVKFIILFINNLISYKEIANRNINLNNNFNYNNSHDISRNNNNSFNPNSSDEMINNFDLPELTIKQRLDIAFKHNANLILQSLILFGIAILLMFIAAIIEANLTIPIASYFS
ncbi:MAG: stage II sporulation protein M [Methanobacteriaceae archaeon]